jgi:hypothetical protein
MKEHHIFHEDAFPTEFLLNAANWLLLRAKSKAPPITTRAEAILVFEQAAIGFETCLKTINNPWLRGETDARNPLGQ